MKRLILCFCFAICSVLSFAQIVEDNTTSHTSDTVETPATAPAEVVRVRYGFCSRSQLVLLLPEYTKAVQEITRLREQFEKEVEYNEAEFRRQYTEYLNGQKDFPQAILLKRQRDLQTSMENGIAFRMEGDSLLRAAEENIMEPLRRRVDDAIRAVGTERNLDYIVDTDKDAFVFLRPELSEDITAFVEEKLTK